MVKRFSYHFLLISLFILTAFAGYFLYTKYIHKYATKNYNKNVNELNIDTTIKPIYLTKAPKCEDVKGNEFSVIGENYNLSSNYSGWAKFCNDSSGYVLAYGEVINGKKNGVWTYYNKDTSFYYQLLWINGSAEGKIKIYKNGKLLKITSYLNDKLEGEYKTFYENGQLKEITNYVNGKLEGELRAYHENGQLSDSGNYVNDKVEGENREYHENGQLSYIGNYINGEREKVHKWYHENGQLSDLGNYVNGKLEGEYRAYHDNGQLKEIENYVNGKLEGELRAYHENGQLSAIGNYVKGKAEGEYKWYYENGQLEVLGNYVNDQTQGKWLRYNEDGSLKCEEIWLYDNRLSCTGNCE